MTALATRRLIDATATLAPADRALVNLWAQRGLDDAALGRMTGVDAATIASRRGAIIERLSGELGLPPRDVAVALQALAASAATAATAAATPPAGSDAPLAPEPDDSQAPVEPSGGGSEPRAELQTDSSARPRRALARVTAVAVLVALTVIAVVAVVALAGGSGASPATHRGSAPTTATSVTTGASPAATSSAPAPSGSTTPATAGRPQLLPLPGGDAHASGTLALTGAGTTLTIHVIGLPAAGTGHYEAWLYNSIIDSAPLGALSASGSGAFRVPARARRYASIDVELQPAGTQAPSGASVLRGPNPLR